MSIETKDCAWCGSEVTPRKDSHAPKHTFCDECHNEYEAESHRSLHLDDERHPHDH